MQLRLETVASRCSHASQTIVVYPPTTSTAYVREMRLHLANANFAKYLYIFVLAKLYYIGVFYHYAPPIYYNAMGSTVNDDSTIRTLCAN